MARPSTFDLVDALQLPLSDKQGTLHRLSRA